MRLMIIGPQGVGKGTQSMLLSQAIGVPHISTGDLFRRHAADADRTRPTRPGIHERRRTRARRSHQRYGRGPARGHDTAPGYLLDGFPRTRTRPAGSARPWARTGICRPVIVLEAPEQELVERLLLRGRDGRPARDHPPSPGAVPVDHPAAARPLRRPARPDRRHRGYRRDSGSDPAGAG